MGLYDNLGNYPQQYPMQQYQQQGPPPWWYQQQGPPPGPPPWWYQQQAPPAYLQLQPQQNMNQNMLATLLPIITTLPVIKNGALVAQTLQNQLLALQPPATLALGQTVTAANYNDLLNYSVSVKNAITQSVGNDSTVFAALKQQLLFGLLASNGSGGSQDQSSLFLVLALSGGF